MIWKKIENNVSIFQIPHIFISFYPNLFGQNVWDFMIK